MRLLYGFCAALLVFVLDQLSKVWVMTHLSINQTHPVLDGFFRITYVRNPNSVFGISLGANFPYVLISLVASLFILILLLREKRLNFIVAYGLILGGALGNMVDRIRWGEVVDFLDFGFSERVRWAVFNLSDLSVTIALILLFVLFLLEERRQKKGELG